MPATTGPREVLSADDIRRALTRIAHEIVERNHGTNGVVLVGLQRGGVWIANELAAVPRGHRAAGARRIARCQLPPRRCRSYDRSCPATSPRYPCHSTVTTVVLVDDVLYTGRTVRAALEALNEYGRPHAVQFAVIIDRGHRQLPIRPDYVGKNLPTAGDEDVQVSQQVWWWRSTCCRSPICRVPTSTG